MTNERGQAVMETLLLGLLLLVPLLWVLGVLADAHRAALGTTAAVKDAGSSIASSSTPQQAARAIDRAVATALSDHQLEPDEARLRWTAFPGFDRGARVEIRLRYPVPVAQAPLLGRVAGPSLWIDARHVVRLHPFISRP